MTLVAANRAELAALRRQVIADADGGAIAVVMTMGALHAGTPN